MECAFEKHNDETHWGKKEIQIIYSGKEKLKKK